MSWVAFVFVLFRITFLICVCDTIIDIFTKYNNNLKEEKSEQEEHGKK